MMRLIAILVAGLTLAGCNTIAGVGEDITGVARSVQQGLPGNRGY